MTATNIAILSAIVGSPIIGIFVTSFYNKGKTKAEINAVNIGAEKTLGDGWKEYAAQQKADAKAQKEENQKIVQQMSELQINFIQLTKDFEEMKQNRESLYTQSANLLKENKAKDGKIVELEGRIAVLEEQVKKYETQSSPDHLAEVAHGVIDSVVTEIKKTSE